MSHSSTSKSLRQPYTLADGLADVLDPEGEFRTAWAVAEPELSRLVKELGTLGLTAQIVLQYSVDALVESATSGYVATTQPPEPAPQHQDEYPPWSIS